MNWVTVLTVASAVAGAISALIASGSFAAWTIASLTAARRRSRRLWPIRSVSASYRGPGGQYVPAGDYRCPRDHHRLDVSYEDARGACSACGRSYTIMFPEPELGARGGV